MKSLIHVTLAATLAVGASAHSQHQHQQFHAKKGIQEGSRVEKRNADPAIEWVVGPTEVVYELGGKIVDADKAKAGIDKGAYVVIGETTPTWTPPPPPATTTSADLGAQFIESKTSSTSTTPPPPPPTSAAPKPAPKPAPVADSGFSSGGQGIDADFPSGKVPCKGFQVDKYGAVALDWLKLGGWSGLQFVPGYSPDAQSISDIVTGIAGQDCSPGCMCSYACPAGYQKTQWPVAQGSTKESIGGLYCNNDGFLELTRPSSPTLCEHGVGGVSVQNSLGEQVAICRTDYPGTENMVIPALAPAGGTVDICNPDQNKYYNWGGMATSAQYYINQAGYTVGDSCLWTSPIDPTGGGNWAPAILGVGKAADGITYISLFQNLPTSNAKLKFNMEVKGDVSSKCAYENGQWVGGSTGCTTGMSPGGNAVIHFY